MALPNKTKIPVGTVLAGKYRITREIGRGGMATVHEAENVDIGKRVAIKVLAQELTSSSIVVERFLREARAAAAIRSPYICDVYDSGKLPSGQPFLVLELLEGESLYERMTRQRQLDVATTIAVITQVCRGLTKAHAASIVHRDLKPENIFLTKDEEGQLLAKILDFGLAKFYTPTTKDQARLTREGAVFGTPAYMSPEQVRGQGAVDHRADLWALGCITYECFTGKTVWSTDQGVAMTFAQIASAPLPKAGRYRPDLPQEFTAWFERSLDRSIDRRFQTAKEFAEALSASFGRETSAIRPSPVASREEAAAALAAAPTAPAHASPLHAAPVHAAPLQPAQPAPAQGTPPSSGRTAQAQAYAQQQPQQAAQKEDPFRPISHDDEDGDPTRVLTKRPQVKQLEALAKPGEIDAKMERFRRTPDGKIAKIVPQVLPNAPPVPAGLRPPPGPPTPVSQRPVPMSQRPAPGSQRPGQLASQQAAPASRRGGALAGTAITDHDTDFDKNPFVKARKRRRLAIVITLLVLAVLVVVFAITSSTSTSGDSGSGSGADTQVVPSSGASTAPSSGVSAQPSAAAQAHEPPLPDWLADVREAQSALASGDMKAAMAKVGQAASKSGQHAAAQGLAKQLASVVWSKGGCSVAGMARPRTYDLGAPGAARVAATKPAVVAVSGGGALAAWTDAHGGASHAYVARLDGSFALAEGALDLTPDGADVRGVDLLSWGDKVVAVYTDAKATSPGTFARMLGADGKPAGAAVRVGPPRSAQASPLVAGEPGQALYVGWTDDGDRDSEDLFLQKLSLSTLEPEGAPSRATDLSPATAPRSRALAPDAAYAKGALRLVMELERKPASFVEMQTIAPSDFGREMQAANSNHEGKALGQMSLVNIDKSRSHAPRIACSQEICFVAYSGESPPGAQAAAFEIASGRALWRRKLSPGGQYPAVAASGSAGVSVWIEDGKLVAAPLGRVGVSRTSKVGRATAAQPVASVVATQDKNQFFAAWLDQDGTVLEPYVARLRCP